MPKSRHPEYQYLDTLKLILDTGEPRVDRTGVGVRSIFGHQMRWDLSEGFPLLTTKKMLFKSVVSELLWFLEGSGDERRLAEIHYGLPRSELVNKTTIWTANAQSDYWVSNARYPGDLGMVYGVEWRAWPGENSIKHDQIANLLNGLKNDPYSRRHIISAWNVGVLDNMALPPCHVMSQYRVSNNKLSCMMTQRSQDIFLGAPFNIASYALLTHMIARECGFDVGELIISVGDCHLYNDHVEQACVQLKRKPLPLPTLVLNPDIKNVLDFQMKDIGLDNYQSHDKLTGKMAV